MTETRISRRSPSRQTTQAVQLCTLALRVVGFVDAAHFVHGTFLGYLWCFTRRLIRGPSGRKRFNVLGAIDAVTHELTTQRDDDRRGDLRIARQALGALSGAADELGPGQCSLPAVRAGADLGGRVEDRVTVRVRPAAGRRRERDVLDHPTSCFHAD